MKITGVSVYQVDAPLAEGAYQFAKGCSVADTNGGPDRYRRAHGWGETTPLGAGYLPAFGGGVRAGTEHLAPCLIGRDPTFLGPLNTVMDQALQGHNYVKSAIDVACFGREKGQATLANYYQLKNVGIHRPTG